MISGSNYTCRIEQLRGNYAITMRAIQYRRKDGGYTISVFCFVVDALYVAGLGLGSVGIVCLVVPLILIFACNRLQRTRRTKSQLEGRYIRSYTVNCRSLRSHVRKTRSIRSYKLTLWLDRSYMLNSRSITSYILKCRFIR